MPQLHMQTDNVRNLGDQFCRVSNAIHDEIGSLSSSVNGLAVSWYGPSSDDFIGEAQGLINALMAMADEGITLALRVQHEAEKWELRDFESAHNFEGIIPVVPPIDSDQGVPETPQEPAPPGPQQPQPPQQPPGQSDDTPPEAPPTETPPSQQQPPGNNQGQPPHEPEDDEEQEDHQPDPPPGQQEGGPPGQQNNQPEASPPPAQSSSTATTGAAVVGAATVGTAAQSSPSATSYTSPSAAAGAPVTYDRTNGWGARFGEMQDVEQQIKELERRPFDTLTPEQATQLQQLRDERTALQQQITEGIPTDGPGPMHKAFEEGQCTWYASGRRNFGYDLNGHAKFWGERAVAAGYEVGEVPVKGAIMVWQPGVHGASAEYGHVSFIERIEQLANGTYKVYYTDNLNMDSNFPASTIITPGEQGVDFIYGKLSG